MSSGGFYSTMESLIPDFEKKTGHTVTLVSGSSMGSSPTAIPARMQRGEKADLLMLAGPELDKLIAQGFAVKGSKTDLVHSKIGMAVRAGQAKPDISTKEAFERTLLAANAIGYSASASGTHLVNNVFPRLGIPEYHMVMAKSKEVVKDRVATRIANGEFDIGFQQISEILPIKGAELVGPIPAPYQKITVFSVGFASGAPHAEAAKTLVTYLTSKDVYAQMIKEGLEPAALANEKLKAKGTD